MGRGMLAVKTEEGEGAAEGSARPEGRGERSPCRPVGGKTLCGFKDAASLHKRAQELRDKYRVDSTGARGRSAVREYYKPLHIGVHPSNRDGSGLNGLRIDQLLESFKTWGFLLDEANHDAVIVLEKQRSIKITTYTRLLCKRDPRLKCPPDGGSALAGGSVAHSHIYQCLRNVLLRAPSKVVGFTDDRGRLSLEKIRTADPALYEACQTGLLCEALAADIEEEEPEGLRIIQASCNRKNDLAMKEHEMQVLARVNSACSEAMGKADAGGRVSCSFERVKELVQVYNPDLVESTAFVGLFGYCTELGVADISALAGSADESASLGAASGVPSLVRFHQEWVNPKVRRLRLDAIASLNALGARRPFLKVAVPKAAYACEDDKYLSDGKYINWFTPQTLKKNSERAEDALRYFHINVAPQLQGLSGAPHRLDVGAKLDEIDVAIARSFAEKDTDLSVAQTAGHYHSALAGLLPDGAMPEQPEWFEEPAVEDDAGGGSDDSDCDSSELEPVVLQFKDGVPLFEPEEKHKSNKCEVKKTLPWAVTIAAAPALARAREEIFAALWAAQSFIGCRSEDVVELVRQKGKPATVVAAKDLGVKTIKLVPLIASSSNVSDDKKKTSGVSMYDPESAFAGHKHLRILPSWSEESRKTIHKKLRSGRRFGQ